jgi:hypothetical protein
MCDVRLAILSWDLLSHISNLRSHIQLENATASAFPAATRLELVDKSCCGVSERTTIKWNHFLTFRRFPAATRPELVDRSCCRELQMSLGATAAKIISVDYNELLSAWEL